MDRALGEHFDQRETGAVDLELEGLLDGALGVRAAAIVVERDPFDEDGAVEPGDHLRDLQRLPGERGAAGGRGGRQLSEERRRRHLAAGHPEDGVVDEDHRHRHAQLGCADDLGQADRRQVAVALVADDDRVRVGRLVADAHGRRPAMRGLRVADVEVVVGEHRAPDG